MQPDALDGRHARQRQDSVVVSQRSLRETHEKCGTDKRDLLDHVPITDASHTPGERFADWMADHILQPPSKHPHNCHRMEPPHPFTMRQS